MSDCEIPQAYQDVERRAAKPHRCCDCRGVIRAGELHHVHSGIWDGSPAYRMCADCTRIRCEFKDELAGDSCTAAFGQLDEAMQDIGGAALAQFQAVRAHRWSAAYAPEFWRVAGRDGIKRRWSARHDYHARKQIRELLAKTREADRLGKITCN